MSEKLTRGTWTNHARNPTIHAFLVDRALGLLCRQCLRERERERQRERELTEAVCLTEREEERLREREREPDSVVEREREIEREPDSVVEW